MSLRFPKYRQHRGSGQALVQIKGRRQYLGKYGSKESKERYRRIVAELCSFPPAPARREPSSSPGSGPVVIELIHAYMGFATQYYVKNGQPSGHLHTVRAAMRVLRRLYGRLPAIEFGPLRLQAIQKDLIRSGKSRKYINELCASTKRMFRWAASQELIDVHIYQSLATVPGLRRGRSQAVDPEPVGPVPDEVLEATLPHLSVVVSAMVRFQRLTGCPPGKRCADCGRAT